MTRPLTKLLVGIAVCGVLLACTAPSRVQTPIGPTAELNDRLQTDEDEGNPRVFAVLAVEGAEVPNMLRSSRRVGTGFGQGFVPYMRARHVEARQTTFRVRGEYLTKAPIDQLVRLSKGQAQELEGELTFTPKEGGVYRLNGRLSPEGSAIWIEDFETGQVVSELLKSQK